MVQRDEPDEVALYRLHRELLGGYSAEPALSAAPRHAVAVAVRALAATIERLRAQFGRPVAMTPHERAVMTAVWEQGSLSVGELCRATAQTKSAMSHIVNRLAARGLLVRGEDPDDRRRVLVSLSPSAHGPTGPFMHAASRDLADRFAGWSERDLGVLLEGLRICREATSETAERLASCSDDELRALAAQWAARDEELLGSE
jgi:DNA-binding MarR family transcriptional regulator